MRMSDTPAFVELRVILAGRDGRPLDLSDVTAEVRLQAGEEAPVVRAMQLMSPAPAPGAEIPVPLDARALPDGVRLTIAVLRPTRPFETWGASTPYFKLDCELPEDAKELAAVLRMKRPRGVLSHAFKIPCEGK